MITEWRVVWEKYRDTLSGYSTEDEYLFKDAFELGQANLIIDATATIGRLREEVSA